MSTRQKNRQQSRQQSRQGSVNNGAQKLQMLSTKEKFQLMELQKTRERIMDELGKYPSSAAASYGNFAQDLSASGFADLGDRNGFASSKSFSGFAGALSPSGAATVGSNMGRNGGGMDDKGFGRSLSMRRMRAPASRSKMSHTASYIDKMKVGLDMVPLLASTGELALEVGLSKTGKVKLPVFRLPTIERASVSALQSKREIERIKTGSIGMVGGGGSISGDPSGGSGDTQTVYPAFLYYNNKSTFKEALLAMLSSMGHIGRERMCRFLRLSEADVYDAELVLSAREPFMRSITQTAGGRESPVHRKLLSSTANDTSDPLGSGLTASARPSTGRSALVRQGTGLVPSVPTVEEHTSEVIAVCDLFYYEPYSSVFLQAGDLLCKEKALGIGANADHRRQGIAGAGGSGAEALAGGAITSLYTYAEFSAAARHREEEASRSKPGSAASAFGDSLAGSYSSTTQHLGTAVSSVDGIRAGNTHDRGLTTAGNRAGKRTAPLKLSSLSALGMSADFNDFLTENQHVGGGSTVGLASASSKLKGVGATAGAARSSTRTNSRLGTSNNNNNSNNSNNNAATVERFTQQGRSRSMQNIRSSSFFAGQMTMGAGGEAAEGGETALLASELISSLRKMEGHTHQVKRDIAQLQQMVAVTSSDGPRARTLLCTVGSEQMQRALRHLTQTDLRRGLLAWAKAVFQLRCEAKTRVVVRFLSVRNAVLGLQRLCHKVLTHSLVQWIYFTQHENKLHMQRKVLHSTITIQRVVRGRIHRKKAALKQQRRRYERLYDSTILIQAIMRGAYTRWKLKDKLKREREQKAAVFIQRCYRGYHARKRVYTLLMRRNKGLAATIIQRRARGRATRARVVELRLQHQRNVAAKHVQKIIRGFVARRTISTLLKNRVRARYAICIQKRMRGYLTRKNLHRRLEQIERYRQLRLASIIKIQAAYRGYKGRQVLRMVMFKLRKKRNANFKAATSICTLVRGYLARCYLRDLKKERLTRWIEQARDWQEMWSDDSEQWFYLHAASGESRWEPAREGYTKYDGRLVLENGAIIDDPRNAPSSATATDGADGLLGGNDGTEEGGMRKGRNRLCSECSERIAIRACTECGDKFCTKCYKATHATGTRRKHTYTAIGPIDCTECELVLAERWCVSCDESYCDACWRKVHSHGKRRFHGYSDISSEGRIDTHIFTMDGEELQQYDSTYAQQRVDQEEAATAKAATSGYSVPGTAATADTEYQYQDYQAYGQDAYGADTAGVEGSNGEYPEWTEYADDEGYPYWYSSVTGVSQYENPYEQQQY